MAVANDRPAPAQTGWWRLLTHASEAISDEAFLVAVDEPTRLVIEKPHSSTRTLLILGMTLPLVPAVAAAWNWGWLGFLAGLISGALVLGTSFFILAAFRCYQRIEIDLAAERLVASLVFSVLPSWVRKFPFAEIDCLTFERVEQAFFNPGLESYDSDEKLQITVTTRAGRRHTVWSGGVALRLVALLKDRLAGRVEVKDET